MPDDNSTLVYSTNHSVPRRKSGEKTGRRENVEVMNTDTSDPSKLTVRLERKGRGGKLVTVIDGLRVPRKKKEGLLRQLKTKLGTGGTLADATLEIQGDHCDPIIAALASMGYAAKRSGG